jgi:hypothetical protein
MSVNPTHIDIKNSLSPPRIGTYENATSAVPNLPGALALYSWNAQVSAALMTPLHICEVVVRNAVAEALESVYGSRWPWEPVFEQSLPQGGGYNARRDLIATRTKEEKTGKVIPELKFVFWQKMFTGRFDGRLWNPHMRTVLPHLDPTMTVQQLRKLIHDELEQLRGLRNRIAHHEPIFKRNLAADFQKAHDLIAFRCPHTAAWMQANQQVTQFIGAKPP